MRQAQVPGAYPTSARRDRTSACPPAALPLILLLATVLAAALLAAPPARGRSVVPDPALRPGANPNGVMIQDGSYVMNVGEVQINITNWGLIGSTFSSARPWSDAPSCQWPAGSGDEYLYAAALWVGGVVLGERLCTTSSEVFPIVDDVNATIYEAREDQIIRPPGNPTAGGRRAPRGGPDDDEDGLVDEETLNGIDDDGDGLVDEDFGQIGNQMMVLTNYDNTALSMELNPDHTPLNLEIVQTTVQWENDLVDDFVGFDYLVTNVGVTDIERVYIGMYADADIMPRGRTGGESDDLPGSWPPGGGSPGLVRASDGTFFPVQVGYMYDGATDNRLDGYFGVLFLGHNVDPTGRTAPTVVSMRTFQHFHGRAAFEQGGDPTTDDECYQLLSAPPEEWDPNAAENRKDDYRFLVSAGPFARIGPQDAMRFQVGLVVGPGLGNEDGGQGLLGNCAEAALAWHGTFVDDLDLVQPDAGAPFNPGQRGRETMLCEEDFAGGTGENPWDSFKPDFMDTSCVDPQWVLNQPGVQDEDEFHVVIDGRAKTCAMFNMDNCFECARQLGRPCESEDFEEGRWTCNDPEADNTTGCTGVDGNERQIHWVVGMAPPPPGMRLWPTEGRVHVYWDDLSQVSPDIRLGTVDFESYRVWRADNWDRPYGSSLENGPSSGLWHMIAEFDLANSYLAERPVTGGVERDTLPLGANTGLDVIAYRPVCLDDPRYAEVAAAMRQVVDMDPAGLWRARPPVRNGTGTPNEYFPLLGRWETVPAVLDTFWAVTGREADAAAEPPVTAKHATRYFEYVDREVHNGFIYFYSVTATDHELDPMALTQGDGFPRGPGLAGDPGSSFQHTVPGTAAQTAAERAREGVNIYVYPNPATRDALAEYQELNPNGDDPTGVRVTFTNLPAARNRVSIYTVAGDLIQTLDHDGRQGEGHISWNLMSRNGQEVTSGVYLYAVRSDDGRFEDFVGKFVVVR